MDVALPHPPAGRHLPLRVLYVITKANWGGAQRYVYDLAVAATEAGHEVTVACGGTGELSARLEEAGVAVVSIAGLGRDIEAASDWRAFGELRRLMHAIRPDVVHSNSSKAGGLAALAARMTGVRRIIFTAHGWAFNEKRPWWQKIPIALAHYVTVLLSYVTICVSAAARRDARWMPFVQKRLHVIHNGVAPIEFVEREEARAKLAPENAAANAASALWIGSIAELHPTKQLDVAIEAFAQIAQKFPDTVLVLIGEGAERLRLEQQIAKKSLSGRVMLCGHVSNAATYLRAFDIFTLPSRTEGLGYVVLEAGLAGLPVVASKVGGIPEIITDGKDGLLVPSGNVPALAKAFSTLLEKPDLRAAYGRALHDRVSSTFSKKAMVAQTLTLY